ncbi:MAG: pseudouridine synthase [Pseudomonadota bacterium]
MSYLILYRSDFFVIVDKPAGILSVPSRQGEADPRPVLGWELEKQFGARLWPVHRLDEEVSGAILFAFSGPAHKAANTWFENRLVEKTYEALSLGDGGMKEGELFTWRCKMARGKKRAYIHDKIGKESCTEGKFIGMVKDSFYWKLYPKTGRSHQLRFEMARHSAPILGDLLYGGPQWSRPGIGLRSVGLDFSQIPAEDRWGLPARIDAQSLRDM